MDSTSPVNAADQTYTVVARRYRPRTFQQLIGQEHVAQALSKAIESGRVGHAYLFTGARGVGKTSTARIFAKALNTTDETADDVAQDISEAIDAGEDMDVIEIDGASNRGIEEIRQLRANVNVRPSRARYKIYIIDEVHMLTNQAFNALLKTLEEPPGHVKFIFCTTDPDKLPITVLSRCQRFDFAPVKYESILERLAEIVTAEGFEADREALGLLARRAAGSMRDSQSLLEQVMSFANGRITVEQIHSLLGTADESQLLEMVTALSSSNGLVALGLVDQAVRSGADAGQLAEQLLNYLRDLMAVGVGAGPELLKLASPTSHENLRTLANAWGLQTVLAAIQLLDEALVRMRSSVSATTLLEVALLQICQLEHMSTVSGLLEALMQRGTPAPAEKKKPEPLTTSAERDSQIPHPRVPAPHFLASSPAPDSPAAASQSPPPSAVAEHRDTLQQSVAATAVMPASVAAPTMATATSASSAPESPSPAAPELPQTGSPAEPSPTASPDAWITPTAPEPVRHATVPGGSAQALADWQRSLKLIDGMLADLAAMAVVVEPVGSGAWNILFPPGAHKPREFCETPGRKVELTNAVQATVGRAIQLSFAVIPGEAAKPAATTPTVAIRAKRLRELSEHPFIRNICDTLEGEILRVDPAR